MNAKELELILSDALQREDVLKEQLAESHRALRAETTAHENTQMQVEKLAAENAGLKVTLEEIEVINRGGQAYCVKDGMSVNPIYARGWNDYRAKALSVETPATNAFLSEVLAQGVDMFADHLSGMNISASETSVREFAAAIRKGVQS